MLSQFLLIEIRKVIDRLFFCTVSAELKLRNMTQHDRLQSCLVIR